VRSIQLIDAAGPAVQLPSAVAGHDDPVRAMVHGSSGVIHVTDGSNIVFISSATVLCHSCMLANVSGSVVS
jgi:hypothetical protein